MPSPRFLTCLDACLFIKNGDDGIKFLKPSDKEQLDAEEEIFLKKLYSFMKKQNTPIVRLPTLGFKEGVLFYHI